MDDFMAAALAEARAGLTAGGSPIGSVFVKDGEILGRGRNELYQTGDPTTHAEMQALRDAARRLAADHAPGEIEPRMAGGTIYTTMMPCPMCAGAIVRFGVKRVIVGETKTYADSGTRPLMERQGIAVTVLQEAEVIALVERYLDANPDVRAARTAPSTPRLKL